MKGGKGPYLVSSLRYWLSAGPSVPLAGVSEEEVLKVGRSPDGVEVPSLDAVPAASAFAFLFLAVLPSKPGPLEDDIVSGQRDGWEFKAR